MQMAIDDRDITRTPSRAPYSLVYRKAAILMRNVKWTRYRKYLRRDVCYQSPIGCKRWVTLKFSSHQHRTRTYCSINNQTSKHMPSRYNKDDDYCEERISILPRISPGRTP